MRTDAQCFISNQSTILLNKYPKVTTIIRFHRSGDFTLLQNSLYSLATMQDCIVIPLIATQGLDQLQKQHLQNLLDEIPWHTNVVPIVDHYSTRKIHFKDIRSKMMNLSIKKVRTDYAAFLDYDDLLMSHAYAYLLGRLLESKKAISVARVYKTTYDQNTHLRLSRETSFEKRGRKYLDFFKNNFIPLHSVMLNLHKLDVDSLIYHDDQIYMEDYFLLLQIINHKNTDWEGVRRNFYIGDYLHKVDGSNILGLLDESKKEKLSLNIEYMKSKRMINELKDSLR